MSSWTISQSVASDTALATWKTINDSWYSSQPITMRAVAPVCTWTTQYLLSTVHQSPQGSTIIGDIFSWIRFMSVHWECTQHTQECAHYIGYLSGEPSSPKTFYQLDYRAAKFQFLSCQPAVCTEKISKYYWNLAIGPWVRLKNLQLQ